MHVNTTQLVRKATHALFDKLHGIIFGEDEKKYWDNRREVALLVMSIAESYLKECDQRKTAQRKSGQ